MPRTLLRFTSPRCHRVSQDHHRSGAFNRDLGRRVIDASSGRPDSRADPVAVLPAGAPDRRPLLPSRGRGHAAGRGASTARGGIMCTEGTGRWHGDRVWWTDDPHDQPDSAGTCPVLDGWGEHASPRFKTDRRSTGAIQVSPPAAAHRARITGSPATGTSRWFSAGGRQALPTGHGWRSAGTRPLRDRGQASPPARRRAT